jgi:hypothetical protein
LHIGVSICTPIESVVRLQPKTITRLGQSLGLVIPAPKASAAHSIESKDSKSAGQELTKTSARPERCMSVRLATSSLAPRRANTAGNTPWQNDAMQQPNPSEIRHQGAQGSLRHVREAGAPDADGFIRNITVKMAHSDLPPSAAASAVMRGPPNAKPFSRRQNKRGETMGGKLDPPQ